MPRGVKHVAVPISGFPSALVGIVCVSDGDREIVAKFSILLPLGKKLKLISE